VASTASPGQPCIAEWVRESSSTVIDLPAEVPLSPCPACGERGRWATVRSYGQTVNILLESTPHRLGMYALLRDGRRAINLVWASEVDPRADWLAFDGQRHRDHFTVCSGWRGLRTGSSVAKTAVDLIASDGEPPKPARRHSRRLRDWA
jgi:hypothetical protein